MLPCTHEYKGQGSNVKGVRVTNAQMKVITQKYLKTYKGKNHLFQYIFIDYHLVASHWVLNPGNTLISVLQFTSC